MRRPRRRANPDPPAETCFRRCRPIRELGFAIQVFLEAHFAPVLLLARRLITGHAYRRIPLTQGRFARVDPEDYAGLAKYKWCASRQSNTFYAVRAEGKRQVRMHRVIMNAPPGLVVDHIDHNGLTNTKHNLRLCTKSQNARNQRPQKDCSSKYIGVCWSKQQRKWYARIDHRGQRHWIGAFQRERAAARARDDAAFALHGQFAHLNFPRRRRRWTALLSKIKRQIARSLGALKKRRSGP